MEIHEKLEGEDPNTTTKKKSHLSMTQAIGQIMLIDAVFSFDSIITAGGTAKHLSIMIAAVVIAMIIMFLFSPKISSFIHKHPTLKMLALSFLIMIGFMLISEGLPKSLGIEIQKESIYFAMAFAFAVELLNMRFRKKSNPVKLKNSQKEKLSDDVYSEK
jgi:predicted tellurium resistance membrane protein TerC